MMPRLQVPGSSAASVGSGCQSRNPKPETRKKSGNCSRPNVGQTSGLPVNRASGPVFRRPYGHGVRDSVNRQTGGLPYT